MPPSRSSKRKVGSSDPSPVEPCNICGEVVSRISDIPRHMLKHNSDAKKLQCPWEGCSFRTLQKSNLNTHYRRHTQDRSFLCKDDPTNCDFQTCDPASLLRHRKRLHNYKPRPSGGRKTNKPCKASAQRGQKASVDSSPVASPFSLESSLESSPSASASPSSLTNSLSPSYSPPSDGILPPLFNESIPCMNSYNSPLHQNESLLFSESLPPCTSTFAWDTSFPPELDVLATDPEIEHFQFECPYPYQDQQAESQAPKLFLPLQFPNLGQVLPGYETTGQLHGSYGLDFGLEQHILQVPSPEVNTEAWFGLSANGSPILYHHNLPAECFQVPFDCSSMICSPVRTNGPDLDMETTSSSDLDIVFDSGVPGSTELADSTIFSDTTNNHQFHQVAFTPIPTDFNAHADLLTQANSNSSACNPGYFNHRQVADVNGEVNQYLHQTNHNPNLMDLSSTGFDYFDQCQWDFGFHSSSGIVEGTPVGSLGIAVALSS